MLDIVSIVAVILLAITSTYLLIGQNWRYSLMALALQYLAAFWLVGLVWPINLAVIKLVVGWMMIAIIGTTQPQQQYRDKRYRGLSGFFIRFLSASLVVLLVFSLAPSLARIIPTGMVILWGGLMLVGMGLLQLGMSTKVPRVLIGLFTMLSGFEILYAALEPAALVAGLLAMVNLGLAMIGSYLILAPDMEPLP